MSKKKASAKAAPKVQAKAQAKVQPKVQAKAQAKVQPKVQQERKVAIRNAVANIGNKFSNKDYKNLRTAGVKETGRGNNKILKIAASSKRVGDKVGGKLSGLNPGIKLSQNPNKQEYKDVGKQIRQSGKKYLQWGGTDAKARPQALGGFKIPKKFRKGSDLSALKIGKKAYKRGSFNQQDGSGSYLGRGAGDILKKNGKPANKVASWSPRNQLGKGYGFGGGGKMKGEGSSDGGFEMPSYDMENTAAGSGIYGGEGTGLNPGAPNFRRRRSRASSNRSNTQGPSRFGTTLLARPAGLNIAR